MDFSFHDKGWDSGGKPCRKENQKEKDKNNTFPKSDRKVRENIFTNSVILVISLPLEKTKFDEH